MNSFLKILKQKTSFKVYFSFVVEYVVILFKESLNWKILKQSGFENHKEENESH